jgi:hypothetical protein
MMAGIQRATSYGYSLFEVQVHGSPVTAIESRWGSLDLPNEFALCEAFPNPFNPTTTIEYSIPGTRNQESGFRNVRLVMYDLLGREVAVLVDERKAPGQYRVTFDGAGLSSGLYICRMTAGSHVASRRMILAK